MRNVLITGASGFIGKNLLLKMPKSWNITATFHRAENFLDFCRSNDLEHVKPFRIDLTSEEEVKCFRESFPRFDLCVYLAANGDPALSVSDPAWDLAANTISLLNVLNVCSFDQFIYFSSGAVYDGLRGGVSPQSSICPLLPYSISNMASEQYVQFFSKKKTIKNWIAVRFFGAFGPYEPKRKIYSRVVHQFAVLKNPEFTIRGNGKNLIDAMYVDDAVEAVMLMANGQHWNQIFDLYSGNPLTLTELITRAADVFKIVPSIRYEGFVPEDIHFYSEDRSMKEAFNFSPSVSLEDGLVKLHNHIKKDYAE